MCEALNLRGPLNVLLANMQRLQVHTTQFQVSSGAVPHVQVHQESLLAGICPSLHAQHSLSKTEEQHVTAYINHRPTAPTRL